MIKIRKATIDDLETVVDFCVQLTEMHHKYSNYYKKGKDIEQILRETYELDLVAENTLILVAEDKGNVIGYFDTAIKEAEKFKSVENVAYIYDVFILPAYRNKGLLKKFMAIAIESYKKQGIKVFELRVDVNNKEALAAWSKLGFKDWQISMIRKI